jgi:hypothetical protein
MTGKDSNYIADARCRFARWCQHRHHHLWITVTWLPDIVMRK